MPEWQITFPGGNFENFNADRLFITPSGVLLFSDVEGKASVPYLAFAPGEWKKVLRVDPLP